MAIRTQIMLNAALQLNYCAGKKPDARAGIMWQLKLFT